MNEFSGASYSDQAVLSVDVSDEAIESAASAAWEKSAALTLAFCTGIDTCPMTHPDGVLRSGLNYKSY